MLTNHTVAVPIRQACGSNVAACCSTGDASVSILSIHFMIGALLTTPRATSSTLRPTALPSLFKRDKNAVRLPATFQHLQSGIMVFGVLGSSINLVNVLG